MLIIMTFINTNECINKEDSKKAHWIDWVKCDDECNLMTLFCMCRECPLENNDNEVFGIQGEHNDYAQLWS